jgi:cobalamin synthase
MSRRQSLLLGGALAAAMVALLGFASPALAGTSEIGRNVGEEVRSWATTLLLGVAGLVAIPVLTRRDVNGGLVLALLVILVGGFAFAQGEVRHVITSLWEAIGS